MSTGSNSPPKSDDGQGTVNRRKYVLDCRRTGGGKENFSWRINKEISKAARRDLSGTTCLFQVTSPEDTALAEERLKGARQEVERDITKKRASRKRHRFSQARRRYKFGRQPGLLFSR